MALARSHQVHARGDQARRSAAQAVALLPGLGEREASHVQALERVVMGDGARALELIRAHLVRWPRDFMVMAPATGVFGLYGFSGRSGREAALHAFLEPFTAACGDDAWFLYTLGFAQCEVGLLEVADRNVDRALAMWPDNANAVHIRVHVDYELGQDTARQPWLREWFAGYAREGFMHCHLAWHMALNELGQGHEDAAWAIFDDAVRLGAAWGLPINLLSDGVSFLLRVELAGGRREAARWRQLADYASRQFATPGLGFADMHSAIAHAMVGDHAALARLREASAGPAADVVAAIAHGYEGFVQGNDAAALEHLTPLMATHERLGGSRAQRDLLEYTVLVAQQRSGCSSAWTRQRSRPLPRGMVGR
jgi:hypothetical protein